MDNKMITRSKLAGYALMLLTLAIGVGLGILVAELTAPVGDILSLSGALLGAAIAVIGAVLTIEWLRRIETDEKRRIIIELLQDVRIKCALVRKPELLEGQERAPAIMTQVDFLIEAIDRAKSARQWVTPDSARMVEAFGHIGAMSVDKNNIRGELEPVIIYDAEIDLDPHLSLLEARVGAALIALRGA